MIPKKIHFCWLSNDPYPQTIQRCIDSWHKILPDYEIVLWNFERLGNNCPDWVREAFDKKMYAFAADWIRVYALYNFGGIYLDSDVEMLRPFDNLLHLPYFVCRESGGWIVEAACMGSQKGHPLFREVLKHYHNRHFVKPDGSLDTLTMPEIFTDVINKNFKIENIPSPFHFNFKPDVISVLPEEYFSPLHTVTLKLNLTPNTYAIHHFAGSWMPKSWHWKKRIQRILGASITHRIQSLKKIITKR